MRGSLTGPGLSDLCAWVGPRGTRAGSAPPRLPGGASLGVFNDSVLAGSTVLLLWKKA